MQLVLIGALVGTFRLYSEYFKSIWKRFPKDTKLIPEMMSVKYVSSACLGGFSIFQVKNSIISMEAHSLEYVLCLCQKYIFFIK